MQTNEALLNRVNAVRKLFKSIKIRKILYPGHVLKLRIPQLIIKGEIGSRSKILRKSM